MKTIAIPLAILLLLAPAPAQDTPDAAKLTATGVALRNTGMLQSMTPAGAARVMGRNLESIFRFVRDEIGFESYSGALRGGEGTLLAGAGNALDQALLLKEMLDAAGYKTRIARGELSAENAAKLVKTIKPRTAGAESLSEGDMGVLGLDQEKYAGYRQAVSGAIDAAIASARGDLAALEIPESPPPARDLVAAARDYWWVQLLVGDRSYDFHPAFPEGQAPVIEPQAVVSYLSSIPEQTFHWVNLRLFGERIEGKDLVRFKLLERKVLSAAVAGKTVAVGLRPVIQGEEVILRPAVRTGELIMGGDEIKIASSDGSPREGTLTALWLEVSVLSPLERPRFSTITLADALSPRAPAKEGMKAPAPKRSLSDAELGFAVELAVLGGALDERVMFEIGADQCEWLGSALAAGSGAISSFVDSGGFPSANPILTNWAAMTADAWSAALPETAVYLDAPAVACMLYRPVAGPKGVTLRTEAGILLLRTTAPSGSRADRTLAGLIATRLLAGTAKMHAIEEDEVQSALPASSVAGWRMITKESAGTVALKGWSEDSLTELNDDLLRRATAIVPASAGSGNEFWWLIEAGTVEPLARGPAGWQLRWRDEGDPGIRDELQAGELLRALAAQAAGASGPERAAGALGLFIERHLENSTASPLATLLAGGK